MAKADLLNEFELFRGNGGGIENWFSDAIPDRVVEVLLKCRSSPISREELNQLLILSHEAGVSEGFFRHYFCPHEAQDMAGSYDSRKLPHFDGNFEGSDNITSLEQLKWGLYRLYVDSLLMFGNIRQGFRTLRVLSGEAISRLLAISQFNPRALEGRGEFLKLNEIARDDRYLIAEIACKTYEPRDGAQTDVTGQLKRRYRRLAAKSKDAATFRSLITKTPDSAEFSESQLQFALDEILDERIKDEDDIESRVRLVTDKFNVARAAALNNTDLYLSMVSDLDVYVATSMRTRADFRAMAQFCDSTFSDDRLRKLKIRYFDPTLSAASGHEDKGLIECLMVKCAKVLVYNAGTSDSYGKDAEAAMALSLGKPVIFYCDARTRAEFYRDVHPLARLINFSSGVAVGAIVTSDADHVPELLWRTFSNKMEYTLEKKADNYFVLKERLTDSTVRLQTGNLLLRETFWNYYHDQAGFSGPLT